MQQTKNLDFKWYFVNLELKLLVDKVTCILSILNTIYFYYSMNS